MAVSWVSSGGVSDTEIAVVAKLDAAATSCRLSVSTDAGFTSPVFSSASTPDANNYVKFSKTGLAANTAHWYRVEIDSVVDTATTGQFRTAPSPGSQIDMEFGFGACQDNASDHRVWDGILARNPRLFVHLGDFFYLLGTDDTEAEVLPYVDGQHTGARQKALWQVTPRARTWDDHDFGNDNSDSTWAGRAASAAVFRATEPHYTLPAGAGNNPIYQSFTYGNLKFILTDLRHQRSQNSATDNASKTMMGATQKQWFKDELAAAEADPDIALIVWGNSQCYVYASGSTQFDTDHWGQFSTERRELVDWWGANITKPMIALSGDSHGVMYHDGRGMTYGTSGTDKRLPVFHAAAIHPRSANSKGGPYTSGPVIENSMTNPDGHYGRLIIEQSAGPMKVIYQARRVRGTDGQDALFLQYIYTPTWTRRPVKRWDGSAWVNHPISERVGSGWAQRAVREAK